MTAVTPPKLYSFVIDYAEAYSQRILFDFLQAGLEEGILTFSKKFITFKRANAKKEVITEFIIYTRELVYYEFNEEDNFSVGIDMGACKEALSNIGKKDSIRMSLLKGDDSIIVRLMAHTSGFDSNGRKIKIKVVEAEEYDLDEYKRALDEQNFVTPLGEFAKSCKPISTGCTLINLHLFEKGIKLEKVGSGTVGDSFCSFGSLDDNTIIGAGGLKIAVKSDSEPKEIENMQIRASDIKNLSKLNNISSCSNVRFYVDKDRPLRISCNIGCYGILIQHMVGIQE